MVFEFRGFIAFRPILVSDTHDGGIWCHQCRDVWYQCPRRYCTDL